MDMERIDHSVTRLWKLLVAGKKIDIPGWQVEHPEHRPDIFSQPPVAWPVGQTCDHVMRLQDGSRIHAQCMTVSGQSVIRLHRDQFDPAHSFVNFILHGLLETPIGVAVGVVALAVAVSKSGGVPAA